MTNQFITMFDLLFDDQNPDAMAIGTRMLERDINYPGDYYWAIVDNHGGHRKAVIWRKCDGPSVRMLDLFDPGREDQLRIDRYFDGAYIEDGREKFCPERAFYRADERVHIHEDERAARKKAIAEDATLIRVTHEIYYRPIMGQEI